MGIAWHVAVCKAYSHPQMEAPSKVIQYISEYHFLPSDDADHYT